MIEKSRVYPEFQYAPERYQIDHFHNPYLAKLNLKLTPRPHFATNRLLSPLSLHNNLYLSQAIPLYRNERLKLALLWKQYITHKYARAHFGLSAEYRFDESLRLRGKTMVGTTSLLELQVGKKLQGDLEGFVGYSGFLENRSLFSSFHLGLRKGGFSAALSKKILSQTEMALAMKKEVAEGIFVESSFNGSVETLRKGELQVMLTQKLDAKSWAGVGVVATPYYREGSVKAEYERLITQTEKLIVSTEYSDGKSIFYFGFKNLNFNFIFPFFAVEGPAPLVIATAAFALTYLYKRFYANKQSSSAHVLDIEDNPKTIQNRMEELQLIGEKAADHYEREKSSRKGLRIEEAYIGPPGELEEFMENPQRFHLLIRSEQHKQKFVDLTVTLRFYVMKGELKLRKGQKNSLLGFYRKSREHSRIGVRYISNGEVHTAFFDYLDPIIISNAE